MPLARKNSESATQNLHCSILGAFLLRPVRRYFRLRRLRRRKPLRRAGASKDLTNDLSVVVGKSALVDFTRPITRVAIGLGEVAEATAVSPTEVMVNGKTPGNTSLIVWEQGGERQFFNVTVRASQATSDDTMTGLRRELRAALPGQDISVVAENNLVFLRGTVNDLASSDRAVQIASGAGKVVNLMYVSVPAPPPQILLKVRFASVDRNLTTQLGINIFQSRRSQHHRRSHNRTIFAAIGYAASSGTSALATITNALNLFFFRPDLNLGATIQALSHRD